jgi:hypothetical protein
MYEINAILLAVDGLGQLAFLTVVNDDLVVFAARYDVIASRREVKTVDLVGVLAEHLGHLEAAHDVVDQLHLRDHKIYQNHRTTGRRERAPTLGIATGWM